MAIVFDIEDFEAVALACPQVRVAALELDVDLLTAGLSVIVLKFYLTIDAMVEHHGRTKLSITPSF